MPHPLLFWRKVFIFAIGFVMTLAWNAGNGAFGATETYKDVPAAYGQDLSRFKAIFDAARSRTVRIGLFGDSQETMPGGAGNGYVARLGYEFWKQYGNVPETQLSLPGGYGDTVGAAAFMLGGQTLNSAGSRLPSSSVPAGLGSASFRDRSVDTYPLLTTLQPNAIFSAGNLPVQTYFKTGSSIQAEIFAATNTTSGDVKYEFEPSTSPTGSYFNPVTASGTLSMGLQQAGAAQIKHTTVTLPLAAGTPYPQIVLSGTSTSVPTDLFGVRFHSTVDSTGISVQTMSAGGYLTSSYLANHGNSGGVINAMGFDAVILHYGANDTNYITAAQFKADQLSMIQWIRTATNDPAFKIILAGDPYLVGLTQAQSDQFDQFAVVQKSIADSDPNVMVLNSRLLTEQAGWSANGNSSQYLLDGVHYNSDGAALLANLEVNTLMGVPEPASASLLAAGSLLLLARRRRATPEA